MIRSSPACWRKRIVCGDFVRVNLSLVMLPITVSSSLMRLMDCQISPLQFSVFWTSKLAEVTTYSPVIVHDASISVYFHFDKTLLFDVSWWLTVGAIMFGDSFTTIWVLSDYWRTESNISMLPGRKIVESSVLVSAVTLWYSDGCKLLLSCSVLMGAQPLCPSWTSHLSTRSWRGSKCWGEVRQRPGTAWGTMNPALSVLRCASNDWESYAGVCSRRTIANDLNESDKRLYSL